MSEQSENAEAMRIHAEAMANKAYEAIGASGDVSINVHGGRFLKYNLYDVNGRADRENGIGIIKSLGGVSSSDYEFRKCEFEAPVLIALGEGLKDPRGPIPVDEFVNILRERGIVTND